ASPDVAAGIVADAEPDVVFHLAGEVTGSQAHDIVPSTLANNLASAVNLLTAVTDLGCDRLVPLGSGNEPVRRGPPASPYAAAKWAQRSYAQMFHALYGTPVTIARPFMVYGPGQPDRRKVVPYSILELLRGEAPKLSNGQRKCDWVYID